MLQQALEEKVAILEQKVAALELHQQLGGKEIGVRWERAIAHARAMLEIYKTIPAGIFGATMIASNISRYDRGDRELSLLEDLEGID